MLFGVNEQNLVTLRRVFQRCVQITLDSPEPILELFIQLERRYGTLADIDDAQQKVDSQMKKIKERKEKEVLKELSAQKSSEIKKKSRKKDKEAKKPPKQEKQHHNQPQEKQSLKRPYKDDQHQQPNNFKKPKKETTYSADTNNVMEMSIDQQPTIKTSGAPSTTQESTAEARPVAAVVADQQQQAMAGGSGIENRLQKIADGGAVDEPEKEEVKKVDDDRSVFLSNLLFTVDEPQIQQMFQECGAIETIRIIVNRVGKSKGYAYLQFKEKESVAKALEKDRTNLSGRPVFVSECVDKKERPTKFKFPTTIDKHTLYVTNIPFEVNEDELRNDFQQVGTIKQVRLVTNRSGKSKGFAYVEYETEADAKSAILKFDQSMMNGRPINVAISNPPARKNPEQQQQQKQHHQQHQQPHSHKKHSSSAATADGGVRGKAKTQISLVPRAIQKASSSTTATTATAATSKQTVQSTAVDGEPSTTTTTKSAPPKSNADFRQFLLKK